jgi:hypothetical protein
MADLIFAIDVTAFKPVLQELLYIDREMYKATEKGLKDAANPLVTRVKAAFPNKTLSGLMVESKTSKRSHGPYPVYRVGKVRQAVTARVGGRKNSFTGAFPILRIRQRNGAAMIYDMAQHDNAPKGTLAKNLIAQHKKSASRTMYPTVRANIKIIEADLIAEIAKAEQKVSARIGAAGGTSQYQAASARATTQARHSSGRFGTK